MSQSLDPRYWGRLQLPEELIDASRAIAKREGFVDKDEFYLFWYATLKAAYPEWMSHATELYALDWIAAKLDEHNNT